MVAVDTPPGGESVAERRNPSADRILVAAPAVEAPGPDVAQELERYRVWSAAADERRARLPARAHGPSIALVVVVRSPPLARLGRLVDSVVGQSDDRWLLVAAVVGDTDPVTPCLAAAGGRLRTVACAGSQSDAEAMAAAVSTAMDSGADAVLVVGHDDELGPGALTLLAAALADGADVVYGDEDTRADDGLVGGPRLKPDWSPELLLGANYLGRPVALDLGLVRRCGAVRPELVAWEYDLILRATEQAAGIVHIPEVLLHRGPSSRARSLGDAGVDVADPSVVAAALVRRGDPGTVETTGAPGIVHVRRTVPGDPMVSIVVPFRDSAPLLRRCVDSVLRTTGDCRAEVVLVDNGSREPETAALVDRLARLPNVRVLEDAGPFNWARINNAAAATTAGDVLLFLNDDVEARRAGWLRAMLGYAMRPDIGAVGARLVYPTGELQHVGVVLGLGGAAGHVLRGLPGDDPGYLAQAVVTRECTAVTGACLMTRRSCFDDLGGFSEELALDLNDVDYCLRLRHGGLRTVVTPLAELVHDESPTRGSSGNIRSIQAFLERWEGAVRDGDPYLNANLTRLDCSCALRRDDEERRWDEWRAMVATSSGA